MSRKLALTILMIILLLTAVGAAPALAAKSYSAERFDVDIAIQPDGTLLVTETVVFRFTGGPFTYVKRALEYTNLDGYDQIQAGMDGQWLPPGTQPGQVEIASGDPLEVTWHFAPTSDSTHEFVLQYRLLGAIRKELDADRLVWRAIPADHDYPIARSLIRLAYPQGLTPLAAPTLQGPPATLETSSQGASFTLAEIGPDIPVDVSVLFPPGSLVSQPPAWQAQEAAPSGGLPLSYGALAFVITGLPALAAMALAGWSLRRPERLGDASAQRYTSPPKDLPPAQAARLTGSGVGFLGTLFDLARRGVLRIEEGPRSWGSRTFDVIRLPVTEFFRPHEKAFLETLFKKAKDSRVELSRVATLAGSSAYNRALDDELAAAGWRDNERQKGRSRLFLLAGLALAMGLVLLLAAGLSLVPELPAGAWTALAGAGIGFSVAGVVGLIIGALVSPLSDEGLRQAAAWKSFADYLKDVTRGREPAVSPDLFERYLPYAAGFGLASDWAKFFQKTADIPTPEWFQGLQSSVDDGSFAAIMAAISVAHTSAVSVSGGGAGGASGGGSSSAG